MRINWEEGIEMPNYGKIMKGYSDKYDVIIIKISDLSKFGSYPEKMKEIYEKGYTQVTINSYLMLKILEEINLMNDWEMVNIEINDPTIDKETIDEINLIVRQIKNKERDFNLMKDYIFWALDEGSIFIDKISILNKKSGIYGEINSNGLIYSENNDIIMNNMIKKIVENYLNE